MIFERSDNPLFVWLRQHESLPPVLCGRLDLLHGRKCVFNYDPSWLDRKDAFPLSPDMPLVAGDILPNGDVHPIFEDAAPDRWGRQVINSVYDLTRRTIFEYLELAGDNRIGALCFSKYADRYQPASETIFSVIDLPSLIDASNALASRLPIDQRMRKLLRCGSSAGGARPKCIIRHEDIEWIAKFPAPPDDCDVCAIEHASLELARLCGIAVSHSRLEKVGRKNVLLVRRFDRREDSSGVARLHFASARTLMMANDVSDNGMGYADIANVIIKYSPDAVAGCHELFRRMVFNIMLENTDDHEKNHGFLFEFSDESKPANGQWSLSPAYDVLPQLQGVGYQQPRVGAAGQSSDLPNAISECEKFMLTEDEAFAIIDSMQDVVRGWRKVFKKAGVSAADIDLCARYIMPEFSHIGAANYEGLK